MTGQELAIELLKNLDVSKMPTDRDDFAICASNICRAASVIVSCTNICGVIFNDAKTDISDGA